MKLIEDLYNAKLPAYSSWISASAGTGKTKLLTDRVLNLLINKIDPENILCLTFTKAAKGEMLSRINENLYNWSKMDNDILKSYLKATYNQNYTEEQVNYTKNLYIQNAIFSKKIKIYTIHAFCQHLLQKFPIEAGIRPAFRVIDEKESKYILNKIILSQDFLKKMPEEILNHVSLFSLIDLLADNVIALQRLPISYPLINEDIVSTDYNLLFENKTAISEPKYILLKLQSFITQKLSKIHLEEEELNSTIKNFINCEESEIISNFDELKSFFLTINGSPRKKLLKKTSQDNKFLDEILEIQEKVVEASQDINAYKIKAKSILLYNITKEILECYKAKKNKLNLLDYEDLIKFTNYLLSQSATREWVKYKLDGGINHILVDESQDTSINQWNIIYNLLSDFFSGQTASDIEKTIFVVGDIKQSIYSFQGARPDLFIPTKNLIKAQCLNANKKFLDIELQVTYRLPQAIYEFVYKVFDNNKNIETLPILSCNRDDDYSSLEIMELTPKITLPELFWPTPDIFSEIITTELQHAKRIACYIKNLLDSQLYIKSRERPIKAEDILILVQKRTKLNNHLSSELASLDIRVAGLDRISLTESLAIKDLISIAKFIINPDDNLNLASLLKSPYLNQDDNYLKSFIGQNSWYKIIILENHSIIQKLEYFKALATHLDIYNFFLTIINEHNILQKYRDEGSFDQIDAIKIFLNELYTTTTNGTNISLKETIEYFESEEIDIKRDLSFSDAVKIMTIHAVKGLEAPVVILADANDYLSNTASSVEYIQSNASENILPIWSNSQEKHDIITNLKENNKKEAIKEYTRLLYVALTRAQDKIVITGIENNNPESWYSICRDTAISYFYPQEDGSLKHESGIIKEKSSEQSIHQSNETYTYNSYINYEYQTPIKENPIAEIKINFHEDYSIGLIMHKFFEDYINNVKNIENFLLRNLSLCSPASRDEICNLIAQTAKNEYLTQIMNKERKHEVEIAAKINNKISLIRLDLLVIDGENLIIVDFKSDRSKTLLNLYKEKLLVYKQAVQLIYPNQNIITKIFWIRLDEWENI